MKNTATKIALIIGQIVFMLVVPVLLVWFQYGQNAELSRAFKLSFTGVICILLVFLIFKRLWLDDKLQSLNMKVASMQTSALVTTDARAIGKLKKALKGALMTQTIISLTMPICILAVAIMTCKAIETGVIKLYGVLVFSAISLGVGTILRVIEIVTGVLPLENKKGDEK